MKPKAIPVAILDVKGMARIMRKAGNASSNSFHFILEIDPIIKLPTMISAGAVMAASPDTALTSGPKKAATIKRIATVTEVRPVRPPAETPEDDSMKAVVGLVPNIAPTVVATESESRALRAFGNEFPFISPAFCATPIIVPVVSKIVTSRKENTTA